ncbi:hypothetical protein CYMTET_13618 [Cymbomonas tetramitiformis]|uniref:RING-type domain-containing protein n=1 Tax=Cymbomonas tetramitiformis TaxID=36881 RepID=A0AAE0LAP8_9CHLO|nr:hypothetical protein CYMTET_13618 [Cymbomonas tetramitiformis]
MTLWPKYVLCTTFPIVDGFALGKSMVPSKSACSSVAWLLSEGMEMTICSGDGTRQSLVNLEDVKITAPPEFVDMLPVTIFSCDTASECQGSCAICQVEYEKDEAIMTLPCKHQYHKDCAEEWLLRYSKTCPVCKVSIMGDE